MRTYMKNKAKKHLGLWLKLYRACLPNSWYSGLKPQKQERQSEKEREREREEK
jgi:hypothetical protein